MAHILIVDDEESICWGLGKLSKNLGHTSSVAASAEQGLERARARRPDVVVLDVRLPGMDGLSAMGQFQSLLHKVPIIVITAYGELQTAVEAVRNGAFEYLLKPFDIAIAQRAIERALTEQQQSIVASDLDESVERVQIVGSSPAIQEVFRRIAVVAPTEASVHIHGESGTGKELVARAIHLYSRRSDGPFVAVNAASLSASLSESELFGHVRGAFTGAEQSRKGLLEQANQGTIFFDELADIPLTTQVKLLRALEYGEILPVGANKPVKSNFRIVTATHQNLRDCVNEGTFREDLYFRLITFEIEIPALRERTQDIRDLALHFLEALSRKNGCSRPRLAENTLELLQERAWTGNVRELRNALEHAIIVARGGVILPEHLPTSASSTPKDETDFTAKLATLIREWTNAELNEQLETVNLYERLMKVIEPPLFDEVLRRNHGQFLAAAKQLGLHRVTLKRKVDQRTGSSDLTTD